MKESHIRFAYAMVEQGVLPGIRLGRRWIVTRYAYEAWDRTWGMPASAEREHQSDGERAERP